MNFGLQKGNWSTTAVGTRSNWTVDTAIAQAPNTLDVVDMHVVAASNPGREVRAARHPMSDDCSQRLLGAMSRPAVRRCHNWPDGSASLTSPIARFPLPAGFLAALHRKSNCEALTLCAKVPVRTPNAQVGVRLLVQTRSNFSQSAIGNVVVNELLVIKEFLRLCTTSHTYRITVVP